MSITDQQIEHKEDGKSQTDVMRQDLEELRQGVDVGLDQIQETEEPQEKPKDRILRMILAIDAEKPLDEQKEAKLALEAVTEELILLSLQGGEKEEDLAQNSMLLTKVAKTEVQIQSTQKLNEIFNAQFEPTQAWWKMTLKSAKKRYNNILAEKEKAEKHEESDETKWMSPAVKGGLMLAAAAGAAYFFWNYFKEEEGKEENKNLVFGSILTTLGLGVLVGSEHIGKWSADYLGLDVSQDAINDLLAGKGVDSLSFSSREPGIKKAAKQLDISERTLIDLKDVKWRDFSNFRKGVGRTGKGYAQSILEAVGLDNMPAVGFDNGGETIKEEVKLESFIKRHEDKIGAGIEDMSIGEILNALEKEGVFGNPEKEDTKETSGDTQEDPLSPEAEEALTKAPHVKAAWEGMKSGDLSWDDGILEMIGGAAKDGWSMGIYNGVLFLGKLGMIIPLSSIDIVCSQFKDLIEAMSGEGEWKDVPFETEQIWWAGSYAAFNATKTLVKGIKAGDIKGGQIAGTAARGAVRGILDSYLLLPKLGVKSLSVGTEAAQDLRYWKLTAEANEPFLSPQERIHVLHKKTAYFAERYDYYFKKEQTAKRQTGFVRKYAAKAYGKLFGEKWVNKMMIKSGKQYLETRQAFLEAAGLTDDIAQISQEGIETDASDRGTLNASAKKFLTDNPTENLPKLPKYRVLNPKYKTHAEATAKGLGAKVSTKQLERLEKLGLTHERVTLRIREFEFSPQQLDQFLDELESMPNPEKTARDLETLLFKIKHPELFKSAARLSKAAGIIGTLYMLHEFQESKDKTNTYLENASMTSSFLLGGKLTAAAIPHPVGKAVGFVVGGTASSLGGQAAWNAWGRPRLQKYFPNRNELFKTTPAKGISNYLASTMSPLGALLYTADAAGLYGDGIDIETDPLDYLRQSKYIWHPDFVKEVVQGKRWWPYGDHRMHDLVDLINNAGKAAEECTEDIKDIEKEIAETKMDALETEDFEKKESLKEKEEDLLVKKAELEKELLVYQSYSDGSWIDIKKMDLLYTQQVLIIPSFELFRRLVKAKFGEEADDPFIRLMQKLQKGQEQVEGDEEMRIWQFLCDEKVETPEGEEVSFADFATLTIANYKDAQFLEEIEKSLAPNTPTPGEASPESPMQEV
ncbi:MAG: hypothetical protein WC777_05705 [Candidatus Gracilibacteria bacterium]|jgi:hypothetical protein